MIRVFLSTMTASFFLIMLAIVIDYPGFNLNRRLAWIPHAAGFIKTLCVFVFFVSACMASISAIWLIPIR